MGLLSQAVNLADCCHLGFQARVSKSLTGLSGGFDHRVGVQYAGLAWVKRLLGCFVGSLSLPDKGASLSGLRSLSRGTGAKEVSGVQRRGPRAMACGGS